MFLNVPDSKSNEKFAQNSYASAIGDLSIFSFPQSEHAWLILCTVSYLVGCKCLMGGRSATITSLRNFGCHTGEPQIPAADVFMQAISSVVLVRITWRIWTLRAVK